MALCHNNKGSPQSMEPRRSVPRQPDKLLPAHPQSTTIDILSKVESLFLQRFFRENLADHFHALLLSLEEELLNHRPKAKHLRELSSEIFLTRTHLNVDQFTQKVDLFYRLNTRQLPHSFRLLFSNGAGRGGEDLEEGELLVVRVKMRADVDRIEELPCEFYREVEECNREFSVLGEAEKKHLQSLLDLESKKQVNLFLVYFGDCSFHLFNKKHYRPCTIDFLGYTLPVRIFVFFISRLGMV